MKKLFKKNQVIITALAIMIAVAGYLNFSSETPVLSTSMEDMKSEGASGNKDDDLISASVDDTVKADNENELADDALEASDSEVDEMAEASVDENGDPIDAQEVGEAVLTNASVTLSQAKLNREQTRSKAKEMLLEIINNETLSEDAKKDAVNEMIQMTEVMEKETAAETQLAAKGFLDAIVSISDNSVDVTLSVKELGDKERTQIEDIVMRKTGCELSNIVITTTCE
ncbi:MAG: SpoIIIAH-like family protein [Lachnospiraceae bacterium]|nr:SpoIIIAH-like family protein [Lachnospiraceae bacterium]